MPGPTIDGTGFHVFGFSAWLDYLTTAYQGLYGSTIDVGSDSIDGQKLGIDAEILNDFEQLLQVVYLGRSPAGAVGASLSRLLLLSGISRHMAAFSAVPITLGGTPGTVVLAGSLIASASDPELPPFQVDPGGGDLTIGGGGTITGQAICTVAGPINLASGDLTKIQTVISGWDTSTNPADAAPGALVEPDPVARARRSESVAMPSQSMLDGLRTALRNLTGVTDAEVYENPTGASDLTGRSIPAHSIHAIVDGGTDADIANAIWVKASMGVTKVGSIRLDVTDTNGDPQEMGWDIPVDIDVYITVVLDQDPNAYALAQIPAALVTYGDQVSRIGRNIFWGDLFSPINDLGITGAPGLPSITAIKVGSAPSPTLQEDLVVPFNARPRFNTSWISVVGP